MPKSHALSLMTLNLLVKKIDGWANNLEKSSTAKIGKHISCGYSMSTIQAFDNAESKHALFNGEDCMKKLYFFQKTYKCNKF